MIFINNINFILEEFYTNHKKPTLIAKDLNVNPSYITKIVKQDNRYNFEKGYRSTISKENRKIAKRDWIRNKRQNDCNKQLDGFIKMQHIQATKELSYNTDISDYAFAKWNRGMFTYDKKSSDLILRKGFKYACDVPKRISNVINPSFIKPIN